MNWTEVTLAALNVFQAVAIAYIGFRQASVKRDLQAANGEQAEAIRALRYAFEERSGDYSR
jgi:hypothetical protein